MSISRSALSSRSECWPAITPAAASIFGLLSLLLLLIVGEVVPKVTAALLRRSLAPLVAWPIAAIVRLLDPALPSFPRINPDRATHRLCPTCVRRPSSAPKDFENAVNVSELSAEMIRQEKQILHNILDLSEIRPEEIMRPRGTYAAHRPPIRTADLAGKTPPGDYIAVVRKGSDDVDGAIVLATFSLVPDDRLDDAAEDVVHVPSCAMLATVLTLMREQVASVASVVNEYGETIGIVTYDDIMDAVLIPEPNRASRFLPREPVLEVAPGCYHVEGITSLRHLCGKLGIEYEPDSDELVTLAGLLHEKLEHLPAVGDECTWRDFRVRVIEVSKRGRLRAMVTHDHRSAEATT